MQPKDLKNLGDSKGFNKVSKMVAMANSIHLQNKNNVFTFYDLIKAIIMFIQLVILGGGMSIKS